MRILRASIGIIVCCSITACYSLASDPATWPYVTEPTLDRASASLSAGNPLAVPPVDAAYLRILGPQLLELTRISADTGTWNFATGGSPMPDPGEFQVNVTDANGTPVPNSVLAGGVGYKRTPLYAPYEQNLNDLRIQNTLYLELANPISDGSLVEVKNSDNTVWATSVKFIAIKDPNRYSPVIHVNQEGYFSSSQYPRAATVGYYLGTLGEMSIAGGGNFELVSATNGQTVYTGTLSAQANQDTGWPTDGNGVYQPQYQKVYSADFSGFTTPGQYTLRVDGLGASYPFRIDDEIAIKLARTYALGLYHQRCGTNNVFPYTRFVHEACHTNPVAIPNVSSQFPSTFSINWEESTLHGYSGAYDILLMDNLNKASTDLPVKGVLVIIIGRYASVNQDNKQGGTLYFRIFDGVLNTAGDSGTMKVDAPESTYASTHGTQISNLKSYLSTAGPGNTPLWGRTLTGDQIKMISDGDTTASFSTRIGVRDIVSPDWMPYPDAASSGVNPPQIAARAQTLSSILPLFRPQQSGAIDATGGHHDAGDYGKYMVNSAMFIHALVFAADNFPGVGNLDNLGIPESGNRKGDLYDEAKWEADFLLKMQDTDGGFFFLVYPTNNESEAYVLPDQDGPQLVWPKTTAATAAAVGALAEIGSSPKFCTQFNYTPGVWNDSVHNPYLAAALKGWNFLINALNTYGKTGCYQKVMNPAYGDEYTHDDELSWAAAAMFAASGSEIYEQNLTNWFPHPSSNYDGYTSTWSQSSLPTSGAILVAVDYTPNISNTNNTSNAIYFRVFDPDGNHFDFDDKPAATTKDSDQIYEARDKLAALKKYLNNWAIHGTGQPPILDQLAALVGYCEDTRRNYFQHMYSGYGCAIRDYAFAVSSGRRSSTDLKSPYYMSECTNEIWAAAADAQGGAKTFSQQNAYGSSLPFPNKGLYKVGWYFSTDWAFDIAVANQIFPGSANTTAIVDDLNYECGLNPNDISFICGLGWRRQRDIVNQFAQNDRRVLPPSGITIGNMTDSFLGPDNSKYGGEGNNGYLDSLRYPAPGWGAGSFGLYDRWADAYNLQTESVSHQIARGLAVSALLAAGTSKATQPWSAANIIAAAGTIAFANGNPALGALGVAHLNSTLDLSDAQVVWESLGADPRFGLNTTISRGTVGESWIEAEATLPDGQRVFGTTNVYVNDPINGGDPFPLDGDTVALYHFNGDFNDAKTENQYNLTASGNVTFSENTTWMKQPDPASDRVVRFSGAGDTVQATIPDSVILPNSGSMLTVEFEIYPRSYNGASGTAIFRLIEEEPNFPDEFDEDAREEVLYFPAPEVDGPWYQQDQPPISPTMLDAAGWNQKVSLNTWHAIKITLDSTGRSTVYVDGSEAGHIDRAPNYSRTGPWLLSFGNFDGDIDEVRISNIVRP